MTALVGRRVAFEPGSTSELLLRAALARNGLTMADVVPVNVSADLAAEAVRLGGADAAVTYEPYLSAARLEPPTLRDIFTAAEIPFLIADVLVVQQALIEERPQVVAALVATWGDATALLDRTPGEARKLIADAVGLPSGRITPAFRGVAFYDVEDNRKFFGGPLVDAVLQVVAVTGEIAIAGEGLWRAAIFDTRFIPPDQQR